MTDSPPQPEPEAAALPPISPMMAKLLASPQCRAIVPATTTQAWFLRSREEVEQMKRQHGLDKSNASASHERDK